MKKLLTELLSHNVNEIVEAFEYYDVIDCNAFSNCFQCKETFNVDCCPISFKNHVYYLTKKTIKQLERMTENYKKYYKE